MKSFCITGLLFLFVIIHSSAQESDERQYRKLQKAAEHYEKIKEREPWEQIMLPGKKSLRLNDTSLAIPQIKKRLDLLGDLRRSDDSEIYNLKTEEAVRQFQLRHGLEDDGIIGPAFMKALNTPLEKRIEQLTVNIERIMADTTNMTGTRIIANIPAYRLYVFENRKNVLSMDIVVGKVSNPTVIFSDTLEHVVFSPYWNVPASIVRNEILPAMNKNSSYLAKNNMEIIGRSGGLPVIRQKPGPHNSLGKVKFIFPNEHNIYFHDTPAKSLFARKNRALSHGCIRLSQPFELARYLLKDQPGWTDSAIRDAMDAGKERWVRLNQPIPVSIIYYTAWVDKSGIINFRDDIYMHDKDLRDKDLMRF